MKLSALAVALLRGASICAAADALVPPTRPFARTAGSCSGSSSSSQRSHRSTTAIAKAPVRRSSSTTQSTATSVAAAELSGGAAAESGGGCGTATIPNEVFNLVKSIVGAGVLSLPYGVAVFGNAPSALIPAVSLIAAMGALSAYTFGLIGRICQKTNTESYSDAWDVSVGKKWAPLIAFSCFIDCFAGNLSYSMILADTVKNLAASAGIAVTRTQSLVGVTGIVLLPLCLLKNLASLAPFSLVGITGILYTTVAMGLRWASNSYAPGGAYFASQLAAPAFGSAGAAAALSPRSLILACMLSNAYIAHFNVRGFLLWL
jgi:Transmembrane amino acid transporter protein